MDIKSTPADPNEAKTQEIAVKIAALHHQCPRQAVVTMVGTDEVRAFVGRILEAQNNARSLVLSVD